MTFELDRAFVALRRTPDVLDRLLRDLPVEWVTANEGPDTWSPRDVLGHLLHGEETDWLARARIILEHGEAKTFDPFDRFAQFDRFDGIGHVELLDEFARARAANVAALRGMDLTEAHMAQTGTHPDFGRVTLRQLLATWVVHDHGHVGQIVRVLAKHDGADTGPWNEYLPILHR